jgi:hypothetical protein
MRASILGGLALSCLTLTAHAEELPPANSSEEVELDLALAEGRLGAAALRCEQLKASGSLSLEVRERCGKVLLGLGDRLRDAGSLANARARWDEAASYDPRLLDDPAYLARLKDGAKPREAATPLPNNPQASASEAPPPEENAPEEQPERPKGPRVPGPGAGPRWDRGFGMGMSFGFDGLVAATLGWLTDETFLLEVSFGIAYPAADVRVRWLGLRNCLTPFLGAGILVPFGQDDRLGLDIAAYDNLYELGESFHVDVGLAYMPIMGLDLHAGVSFLTPMDRDHPDTVLFFPQFMAGASWYF